MPPAKRVEAAAPATQTKSASQAGSSASGAKPLLEKGKLVNLEKGGRTLTDLEVLDWDDNFVKFRWSVHVSPQTEIVLIPWAKIEAIGLVGER